MEGYFWLPEWAQCDYMPCSEGALVEWELREDRRTLGTEAEIRRGEEIPGCWLWRQKTWTQECKLPLSLGNQGNEFSATSSKGVQFYGHTVDLDLQNWEIMNGHCFNQCVYGHLLQQQQAANMLPRKSLCPAPWSVVEQIDLGNDAPHQGPGPSCMCLVAMHVLTYLIPPKSIMPLEQDDAHE